MAVKRIGADVLLDLALDTLRNELSSALPADQRYAAAMVANAIEIARREFQADVEAPMWTLLDDLYESGEGSPRQLARDIRSGDVSEAKNPGLAKRLLKVIESELAIANPRFLKSRT